MKRIIFLTLVLALTMCSRGYAADATTSAQVSVVAQQVSEKGKNFFSSLVERIDPWRLKEAEHFVSVRDEVKTRLGIAIGEKVGEAVQQQVQHALTADDLPLAPDQTTPQTAASQSSEHTGLDNPMDYVTLFYSTSLAAIFGNKPIFYITLVLLTLMAVRFVFKVIF